MLHLRNTLGNYVIDTSEQTSGSFETMVFRIVGGKIDFAEALDENRYSTKEDAIKGHEEMIRKWS